MTVEDEAELGARERRRRRSMRELSHTAVDLFERQGFDATTVEDIAQAADYSASTFFRMFARKEDCVFFDLDARLGAASATVARITLSGEWATIREALMEHARSWEGTDPEFARARTRLFHREPALVSRYLDYCHRWEEDLSTRILERGGDADPAAVHLASGVIVTAYRTAFRLQAESGGVLADRLDETLRLVEDSGFIQHLFGVPVAAPAPERAPRRRSGQLDREGHPVEGGAARAVAVAETPHQARELP